MPYARPASTVFRSVRAVPLQCCWPNDSRPHRRSFEIQQLCLKLKWESNWKSQFGKRSLSFVYVPPNPILPSFGISFVDFVRKSIVGDLVSSCCALLYVHTSAGLLCAGLGWFLSVAHSFAVSPSIDQLWQYNSINKLGQTEWNRNRRSVISLFSFGLGQMSRVRAALQAAKNFVNRWLNGEFGGASSSASPLRLNGAEWNKSASTCLASLTDNRPTRHGSLFISNGLRRPTTTTAAAKFEPSIWLIHSGVNSKSYINRFVCVCLLFATPPGQRLLNCLIIVWFELEAILSVCARVCATALSSVLLILVI